MVGLDSILWCLFASNDTNINLLVLLRLPHPVPCVPCTCVLLCSSFFLSVFHRGEGDRVVAGKSSTGRAVAGVPTTTATPVAVRQFGSSIAMFTSRAATVTKTYSEETIDAVEEFAVSIVRSMAKFSRVFSLYTGTSSGSSSGSNSSDNKMGNRSIGSSPRSKSWTQRSQVLSLIHI